jgi:hypothetical protein
VQLFNRDGRLLMFFGRAGDEPGGLQLPARVAVDYDNLEYFRRFAAPDFELDYVALVTSQFGPRLVNVFGYGRQKGKQYPSEEELLRQIEERRKAALERLRQAAPAATAPAEEPPAPAEPAPSEPPPDPTP